MAVPQAASRILIALVALVVALAAAGAARAGVPDPLHSPMWDMHAARLFANAPVVFDKAVRVDVPQIAENQHVFPVTVDARALGEVRRIVILADLNPIPVAVDFAPSGAAPWLSLRIKLDQRTPVRAAVLAADGKWHVSGVWVDAAGGGCSAPPVSRAKGDWAQHLGELRGAMYSSTAGPRLRFTVRHPMDTGLVENIPAYNIETIRVASGPRDLATIMVWGSVAEDPAFSLLLPAGTGAVTLRLRDSNGREFTGHVAGPQRP
ncbi:quinoprotein dehydrogenase-associated SoxYZ-like carrier [Novosphingobium aerophilum]|uniref:Quinoprotein dehydrogenase-associated SoxYZ-like carrier n=2 Tax=Novosphingobium aerophilum TaxID=2839843 RepID=A0A7X1KDK6_9SPHN|nr:quinoprotein dehydrogenase-associated SoxYZ-like carrier [Novosphingobium aerophilum]MBC2653436.1 quinoprotein dehydrogenase-associated SoxYZ-like carrier [Novosphingobium aerophilum]